MKYLLSINDGKLTIEDSCARGEMDTSTFDELTGHMDVNTLNELIWRIRRFQGFKEKTPTGSPLTHAEWTMAAAVLNYNSTRRVVNSLDELAALVADDDEVLCSSSLDFPHEYTDDAKVIELSDAIRDRDWTDILGADGAAQRKANRR